ncbi:hypothetical protein VZT92_007649 [Zoarces viviparus]|uniref:Uncharacterized protein n=1 Tax=Zoarces viviparus TaxID=48416 RepID=A0AAW1FLZ0_ZOAVI
MNTSAFPRNPTLSEAAKTFLWYKSTEGWAVDSGLRLSGRSGGICIYRAVRMEGRECKGISVRECIADQAGDMASWRNSESYDSVSV